MSWLLHHTASDTRLLFDLGLPKDKTLLTPASRQLSDSQLHMTVTHDAYDSLAALDIDPATDLSAIIFSHLHFDHIGDPRRLGPDTKFIVGPATVATHLTAPRAWPDSATGSVNAALFPAARTHQMPEPRDNAWFWQPLGPFAAAHDYFHDGSLFVVHAPGHVAGHVNVLLRAAPEGRWVYLAADTCHFAQLLTGEDEAAVYADPAQGGRRVSAHEDLEAAEDHMERVLALQDMGVEVILAHDASWLERNPDRFV